MFIVLVEARPDASLTGEHISTTTRDGTQLLNHRARVGRELVTGNHPRQRNTQLRVSIHADLLEVFELEQLLVSAVFGGGDL